MAARTDIEAVIWDFGGVFTSSPFEAFNRLEAEKGLPKDLIRRINEAARHIPLENLALSPQCGFASTMEGNLLTEEDQWAKLRLVVETAREVWR